MKKHFLLPAAIGVMLLAASCSKNDNKIRSSYQVSGLHDVTLHQYRDTTFTQTVTVTRTAGDEESVFIRPYYSSYYMEVTPSYTSGSTVSPLITTFTYHVSASNYYGLGTTDQSLIISAGTIGEQTYRFNVNIIP